jgi:peptidyl-prolyl cis-trans isomerase B (cyclophilin B)
VPTAKQRREAERRRLQRRAQRRAHLEARRRRYALIASIVGTLLVIGIVIAFVVVTSDENDTSTAGGSESLCTWTKTGTAAKAATVPPTVNPSHKGTVDVSVQTSQGAMTFTLNRAKAPCAVESFVSLAAQHYYDSTSCHRLTTSGTLNVLQCGDPLGDGSGGPGYSFADELTGTEKYTRGILAMANSGTNTNGSQFFIVYKDSQLPAKYTVFGTVTDGLSAVDRVAAQGSMPAGDGTPKLPIKLTKVTVAK